MKSTSFLKYLRKSVFQHLHADAVPSGRGRLLSGVGRDALVPVLEDGDDVIADFPVKHAVHAEVGRSVEELEQVGNHAKDLKGREKRSCNGQEFPYSSTPFEESFEIFALLLSEFFKLWFPHKNY